MFKQYIFFIIIFQVSVYCHSQKIYVVDAVTKNSIPYANFSIMNKEQLQQGGYCSEKGALIINKNINFDHIMVSCIGYTNLDISKEMIQNDTLLLKPAVYHLKEVLVKASKKIDRETLGYANSKIKSLLSAIKGMEICTYIENPYHEVKTIHSVLFKIRNPNKTKLGFRLHLYELDTIKKKPSKDLLDQNIIITIENKGKNVIEYDVSAYNLELPSNGAFIGIEWLGELNDINNFVDAQQYENGFIELNDKTDSFTTFQRNRFSIFPWTNMERFKKNAENYQKYNNCPNASFGISIYKE